MIGKYASSPHIGRFYTWISIFTHTDMGDDKQYTAIMMVVKQISGSSDKYLILQIFVSFGPPCVQIEEVMYLHLQ